MDEHEAARRVIEYLRTCNAFDALIERINRLGAIAEFTEGIANAIKVQEE